MGRTSVEQERVINVLDELLTFAYVYEGELGAGSHIAGLKALGQRAWLHLGRGPNLTLFPTDRERRHALFSALNRTQQAAASPGEPSQNKFEREWLNIAGCPTAEALRVAHARHGNALLQLAKLIAERLADDPTEIDLITRDQVRGTLLATLPSVPACSDCPIHIQSLVAVVHQHFRARFISPHGRDRRRVVWDYMRLARMELNGQARESVVDSLVRKLLPEARKLSVGMGRFYTWAQIWDGPVPAKELLAGYAALNASGSLHDSKYRRPVNGPVQQLGGVEFIKSWAVRGSGALQQTEGSSGQLFFNTDLVEVRIRERAVQKHVVMAMRYDAPVHELDEKLRSFRMYLLTQRRRHCATSRKPLQVDEVRALQRSAQEAMMDRKKKRVVLHDTSSVLIHLCALLWLERHRQPQPQTRHGRALLKTPQRDIIRTLEDEGFTLSLRSVRRACANSVELPAQVRRDLAAAGA